jgi:hypothetical protein
LPLADEFDPVGVWRQKRANIDLDAIPKGSRFALAFRNASGLAFGRRKDNGKTKGNRVP